MKMEKQERSLIRTPLHAIDTVTEEVSKVNFGDMYSKKLKSYEKGFVEPTFWDTKESQSKPRHPILNQQMFILDRPFFGLKPEIKKEKIKVEVKTEPFGDNDTAQGILAGIGKELAEGYGGAGDAR